MGQEEGKCEVTQRELARFQSWEDFHKMQRLQGGKGGGKKDKDGETEGTAPVGPGEKGGGKGKKGKHGKVEGTALVTTEGTTPITPGGQQGNPLVRTEGWTNC